MYLFRLALGPGEGQATNLNGPSGKERVRKGGDTPFITASLLCNNKIIAKAEKMAKAKPLVLLVFW